VHTEAGAPERLICDRADSLEVHLVVLFDHRHGRPGGCSPRSVGHTARFVLDHAPCPVLVLRLP
jgi:nucleotide-binding universal stress UspA family protein